MSTEPQDPFLRLVADSIAARDTTHPHVGKTVTLSDGTRAVVESYKNGSFVLRKPDGSPRWLSEEALAKRHNLGPVARTAAGVRPEPPVQRDAGMALAVARCSAAGLDLAELTDAERAAVLARISAGERDPVPASFVAAVRQRQEAEKAEAEQAEYQAAVRENVVRLIQK